MKMIVACLALLVFGSHATAAEITRQPNVLLIIADDIGYTDYGFMGHSEIQTPHIDRLAEQSLQFRRGYVTCSFCCPSLASIITGLYPHQTGVTANDPPPPTAKTGPGSGRALTAQWNSLLDHLPTMPRVLAQHGYLSFQTGKWWQGDFSHGGFTSGMSKGGRHGDAGLTIGREGLEPIYEFIRDAGAKQKPFFVWYAPMMPHMPHNPPDALLKKYAARTDLQPVAAYWAMCEWFDQTCGELLGYLDREGLAENTLVLYLADNGWIQSKTKGLVPKSKTSPYDFGYRTPIMVRWPGHVTPRTSEALASSVDLFPTMLAALGIAAEKPLPGVDLLDDRAVAARHCVFGESLTVRSLTLDDPTANLLWRWTIDGKWRLMVPRTYQATGLLKTIPEDAYLSGALRRLLEAGQPMLFDVLADPHEDNNLAAAHPEIVEKLMRELDAWWTPEAKGTE